MLDGLEPCIFKIQDTNKEKILPSGQPTKTEGNIVKKRRGEATNASATNVIADGRGDTFGAT